MKRAENEELLERMKRLYLDEKLSLKKIGKLFGCSRQAVHERFKRAGIITRPIEPKKTLSKAKLIRLNQKEKLTVPQIAEKLNAPVYLVREEFKRHKIKVKVWQPKSRKFPQFAELKIGEQTIIKRENWKNPHCLLYQYARSYGIRISIKRADTEHFWITRKG